MTNAIIIELVTLFWQLANLMNIRKKNVKLHLTKIQLRN